MTSIPLQSLVLAGSFLGSIALTAGIRQFALRQRLLAIPQSRSAHATPVPLGGGLSIVLLVAVLSTISLAAGILSFALFLALSGGFAIALLGLFDDVLELPIRGRVFLQFTASLWSLFWIGPVAPIDVGVFILEQPLILGALGLFALVWLLNLYNFMDGIDGLAGSELLTASLFLLLFVFNSDAHWLKLLSVTLAGAAAGFLVWNWAPARIFMGDAGSGFVGFLLGLLALKTMQLGLMTVWTWLILLGVFVTDATITLLRRAVSGQRWYEGHAFHGYQHAARFYKSHAKVTITVIMINCSWLGPIAALSAVEQSWGLILCIVALFPLVLTALRWQAGKPVIMDFEKKGKSDAFA